MKNLFLEVLETELIAKEAAVMAAHKAIKTRQEAVMNLKIEELIKINQVAPTISTIGKLHAPVDGYLVDDREYLAGQFIPSPIDEDDLRVFAAFKRKSTRIKVYTDTQDDFSALLERFSISTRPELSYGKSWIENGESVAYCYVEWNSAYLDAITEANTKIQDITRAEATKGKGLAPEGKVNVKGVLSFTKLEVCPYYGPSEKMLVTLDNGSTVWGTLPKALNGVESGVSIEFTATFTVSKDSTHAYFKRPSKVKIFN